MEKKQLKNKRDGILMRVPLFFSKNTYFLGITNSNISKAYEVIVKNDTGVCIVFYFVKHHDKTKSTHYISMDNKYLLSILYVLANSFRFKKYAIKELKRFYK